LLILVISASVAEAQNDYQSFYEKSVSINNTGMYVLGSWAIANIAVGAYGWANNSRQSKYFHQMNLFWNTVNLSIVGFALYRNYSGDISLMTAAEMMSEHSKVERLYLINAGLDVLYVGTGFLLKHLAENNSKRRDLLKGYGNSVILQGSFLFVFDLVMWSIQRNNQINFGDTMQFSYAILNSGLKLGSLTISF